MIKFLLYLITLLISFFAIGQINEIQTYTPSDIKLHNEIVKMDTTCFTPYNT